jgi:AraC family transcriptional regulator
MTEIYIKNMVCRRCIHVVGDVTQKLGLKDAKVEMGVLKLSYPTDKETLCQLSDKLSLYGFELLDTAKTRLIEQIKNAVISKIHHADTLDIKVNWSALLSALLNHDYTYLSTLFSSVEGITLEQFIIRQKIERVKELLFYDELNLNEISYKLGYSSVQHLSTQFKKVTGETPSQFRLSHGAENRRKPLDSII